MMMIAIVSDRTMATKYLTRRQARGAATSYKMMFPGEEPLFRIEEIGSRFYVIVTGIRYAGWLQAGTVAND